MNKYDCSAILTAWQMCPEDPVRRLSILIKDKCRQWWKLWGLQFTLSTELHAKQTDG